MIGYIIKKTHEMNILKITLLIVVITTAISCRSTKSFYFLKKVIPETKVYKFVNESDTNDIIYWEMYYKTNDTLVTNTYDSKLILQNEFIEVLGKSNSKLTEYTSYYEFHDQPVKANISKDMVFNWSHKEPIEYKVDFQVDQDKITITKHRKYLSTGTAKFKGKELETKKFEDTYFITVNSVDQEPTKNISYYANGIGVIQFDSHTQNGINKMKLETILTEKQFRELNTYR